MSGVGIDYEKAFGFSNKNVVGVDEVGRGCLAGPVVAAAALLPKAASRTKPNSWVRDVTDSKLLTPEQRSDLYEKLVDWLAGFAIASASVEEIDRLNIFHASQLAMRRALKRLSKEIKSPLDHVLVDGKFPIKNLKEPQTPIVKGDSKSLSIAAASILAKVWRDRHLEKLAKKYPGYDLKSNKGYPTPKHRLALQSLGLTEIHRRSFAPVAEQLKMEL